MCRTFSTAPNHVRSALLPRIEASPGRRMYDYCHEAENSAFMDRPAYHAILSWVDENCRRCPSCSAK